MIEQSVEQGGAAPNTGPLDVQLAVEIDDAAGCPLRDRELEDVRQSVSRSGLGDQATCQVAVADGNGGGYERTTAGDTCPCLVFDAHDCICDVKHVSGGTMLFSAVVPSRDVLRSIISDLRALGTDVSLERIRTGTAPKSNASDCVALTEKQREVLELAIESGYYDRPRETTLAELADELDVTASAVSQRLNAVERKLVCERAREFDLQ
jgi:hypothetical protein